MIWYRHNGGGFEAGEEVCWKDVSQLASTGPEHTSRDAIIYAIIYIITFGGLVLGGLQSVMA